MPAPEIFLDGFSLRRQFDDDQLHLLASRIRVRWDAAILSVKPFSGSLCRLARGTLGCGSSLHGHKRRCCGFEVARAGTGPDFGRSSTASGGRRGLRSYSWLGSFLQAKDILAMLPKHQDRKTEQHWDVGRLKRKSGNWRSDRPLSFQQATRFEASQAGKSRWQHRLTPPATAAQSGRPAGSQLPSLRESRARPDRDARSWRRQRRRCPVNCPNSSWARRIAAVALRQSRTNVSAASHLLPVRSTLVAPILPEPISRTSPFPARRVSTNPNGIDPRGSRAPKQRASRGSLRRE